MAIRDIIKDLPDDATVKIGENEVKVADLRQDIYDPDKYVSRDDYNRINAQHQELGTGVINFLNRAAAATAVPEQSSTPAPAPQDPREMLRSALGDLLKTQGYDYSKDEYVTPAMKMAEERAVAEAKRLAESEYLPRISRLEEDNKAIARQAILAEENSWWRMNRSELPKRPDGNPYSLADLRQLAMANNVKDERGYPDYDRLKDALLLPTRQSAREKEIEDQAYKKGLADARKAAASNIVDIPGRGFIRAGESKPAIDTKGKTAKQILDESLAAAFEDQDILSLSGQA